jgi:hypothetical protein
MEDIIIRFLSRIEEKNVKYSSLKRYLYHWLRFEWMQEDITEDRTIYIWRKKYGDHKLYCAIVRPLNSEKAVFANTWTENY